MNAETTSLLTDALKLVLMASTPVLLALANSLARKLEAWLESKTTNETLKRIEHEAFEVVASIAQSVAEPIKEAAADGKLTDEERQRIKGIALDKLRERLGALPASILPDLEKRLSDSIEAAVCKIGLAKSDPQPAPAAQR